MCLMENSLKRARQMNSYYFNQWRSLNIEINRYQRIMFTKSIQFNQERLFLNCFIVLKLSRRQTIDFHFRQQMSSKLLSKFQVNCHFVQSTLGLSAISGIYKRKLCSIAYSFKSRLFFAKKPEWKCWISKCTSTNINK